MKKFVIEFTELPAKNGHPRRFGHLKIRLSGFNKSVWSVCLFSNPDDMFSHMKATAGDEMKRVLGTDNLQEILTNAEIYHSLDNVMERIDIRPGYTAIVLF